MSCSDRSVCSPNAAKPRFSAVRGRRVSSSSKKNIRGFHFEMCKKKKKKRDIRLENFEIWYTRPASFTLIQTNLKRNMVNIIYRGRPINPHPSRPYVRLAHIYLLRADPVTWLYQATNPHAQSVVSCRFLVPSGGTAAITAGAREPRC